MTKFKNIFLTVVTLLLCSRVFADVESVYIESRLDPNAIIITQVDIVFVYGEEVLNSFPETKTAWYSNLREFIAAAGEDMDVRSVFIPQGFNSEMASLPERRAEALKVFIFAEHDSSTAPPIDVTDITNVLVEIDEFGIVVSRRN